MKVQEELLIQEEIETMLTKVAIQEVPHVRREFLIILFLVSKKDGGKQTNNKSETLERIYSIPTFQNGRSPSAERYAAGGRLYVHNRLERCIFYDSYKSRVQEVLKVSVARKPVRVPVPLFRARPSSVNIYKVNESSSLLSKG